MGFEKVIDPIEKFQMIFEGSDLKYKTIPRVIEKGGIQGMIGGKKLDGFTVECDKLQSIQSVGPVASSTPAVNYSMSSNEQAVIDAYSKSVQGFL
jgi:hypothetical protein